MGYLNTDILCFILFLRSYKQTWVFLGKWEKDQMTSDGLCSPETLTTTDAEVHP